MLILDLFLPVIGPLVGGFSAGAIARGGPWNAGLAGLLSGILGGIVLAVITVVGSALPGGIGLLSGLFAGAVLLLVVFLIHGILAFIAGAVAGVLRP